jgi:hypothetical protein
MLWPGRAARRAMRAAGIRADAGLTVPGLAVPRLAATVVAVALLAVAVPATLLATAPASMADRSGALPGVRMAVAAARPGGLRSAATLPVGLFGVSCPAAARCMTVGSRTAGTGARAIAVEWLAGRWRSRPVPVPKRASSSYLNEVSCGGDSHCAAVGSSVSRAHGTAALAEVWDGRRWRLAALAIPATARASELLDVSCAAAASCFAVGDYTVGSGASRPLSEHWNGSRWRLLTTPEPAGTASAVLDGISCRAARCLAVGFAQNSPDPFQAAGLAQEWTGHGWRILAFPDPGGAALVDVQDVSCPPRAPCLAAGFWEGAGQQPRSLAERWRAGRWQLLKPPPAEPPGVLLNGVSCPAAARCVAVGTRLTGTRAGQVLTGQAWNGSRWRTMRFAAPPPATASFLNQVSCPVRARCLAVGGQGSGRRAGPLAERWDGTGWRELRLPAGA